MTKPRSVWTTLAEKEAAHLVKLNENKAQLHEEKSRLEARLSDIENYIHDYSRTLDSELNQEIGIKQLRDRSAMITQLQTAKKDLLGFHQQCGSAIAAITQRIVGHQSEILKYDKVNASIDARADKIVKSRENSELDAMAIRDYLAKEL